MTHDTPPWWAIVLVLLSPILYPFTHRKNGHSFRDYIEFMKGN